MIYRPRNRQLERFMREDGFARIKHQKGCSNPNCGCTVANPCTETHNCRVGSEIPCNGYSFPDCPICDMQPCGIYLTISDCPTTIFNGNFFLTYRDPGGWPFIACLFYQVCGSLHMTADGPDSGDGLIYLVYREEVDSEGETPHSFWHVQLRRYVEAVLVETIDIGTHSDIPQDAGDYGFYEYGCCETAAGTATGNGSPTRAAVAPCCGCCGTCDVSLESDVTYIHEGIMQPLGGRLFYNPQLTQYFGTCQYRGLLCAACQIQAFPWCGAEGTPALYPLYGSLAVDLSIHRCSLYVWGYSCGNTGCIALFSGGGDVSGNEATCVGGDFPGDACDVAAAGTGALGGTMKAHFTPGCGF